MIGISFRVRVGLLSLAALCGADLVGGALLAKPAIEQDTSNGVAPLKPEHRDASAAAESGPAPEGAAPAKPAAEPEHAAAAPPAVGSPATPPGDAQRYCENIAAVAAEARSAWQTKKLAEVQSQVSQRIAELEKKQGELQDAMNRRDEVLKRAQETLIAIYAKMAPDAAAAQLTLIDETVAAAVLQQLNPRQSSAILNEIKPDRASLIIGAMTSLPTASDKTNGKKS